MSEDSDLPNTSTRHWLTTIVDHPPLWLAIVIGAVLGFPVGWGIGQAFGLGWIGGVVGTLLGGIVGIDYYLPRPDWLRRTPGKTRQRFTGPFGSAINFLGCTAIAGVGGFYFGQADQRLEFVRQESGVIQGTLSNQFAYGWQRSVTAYHNIQKADMDVHGGLMLRTDTDLPEFVGAISGEHAERINQFIHSSESHLSLPGPAWLKLVSPGFYAVALLMGWLTIRQFKYARHQLAKTIRSRESKFD